MKRILVFSLLSCTLLVACTPSRRQTVVAPPYGYSNDPDTAPSSDMVPPNTVPGTDVEPTAAAPTPKPTPVAPVPPPTRERLLYGIPEPGRLGTMRSPYNPDAGLIDYRGQPPGTEVKDPYTPGKTLLVP